jgi:XTP/dITP diphosphohydrolase
LEQTLFRLGHHGFFVNAPQCLIEILTETSAYNDILGVYTGYSGLEYRGYEDHNLVSYRPGGYMTIWFATGNAHKKAELAAILADHDIRIPAEAGVPELTDFNPEETGGAFLENALIKARELYRLVREPVIADDSGLCVDALGGRPGIYSSRYGSNEGYGSSGHSGGKGGQKLSDGERNALLLEELNRLEETRRSEKPETAPDRRARFVCAMVLLYSPDRFFIAQETLEGEIVRHTGRGSGGFGYDPILYLPDKGCTVAELPEAEKNRISHRGKAGRVIAKILAGVQTV